MPHAFHDIAFTPQVQALQSEAGSRDAYDKQGARLPEDGYAKITQREAEFLTQSESFYLASISETGWPYIQHRGGAMGFVKLLAPDLIGWAEYAGNRQYITTGNLRGSDRVSLFFMDYLAKRRLKMLGQAQVIGPQDPRMTQLLQPGITARVERGMLVQVAGFDWNCPQHIPQRFSLPQVEATTEKLLTRIAELEAALQAQDASPSV
ncbi:MAG: pyridoxamine 5'-phosphate oxidase family protein [Mangrovicoccus sp.]